MSPSRIRLLLRTAKLGLALAISACGVSEEGLGSSPDGATNGGVCPARLTDLASWPANYTEWACVRSCGPDDLGQQTCSRVDDVKTCQAHTGCVCLEEPCVVCADCTFEEALPACYLPTNGSEAPSCPANVAKGTSCAPACDRRLCKRKDGKTACLCNDEGAYACGDWGESGWK
jgi:hypothetical protein